MAENKLGTAGVTKGLAALIVLAVFVALLILPSTHQREPESTATVDEHQETATMAATDDIPRSKSGRDLYVQHCAACHGENGDGRGVAAAYLFPKPRDLRAGRFRLVSTSNNVLTLEDLDAVLVRGMPGSSMPSWAHLSERDRAAVAEEVMRLRAEGARETYVRTLKEEEELTDEEIAQPEVQEEVEAFVKRFTTPGESSEVPEFG